MKNLLIPGALALLAAAPAFAQSQASLEQVVRDLAALTERVGRLEQDNVRLKAENSALQAENERLTATPEHLKDDAPERASRFSWKADMRYRHEFVDPEEAAADQTRHRIRARLALTAKINDTLSGTIGLATSGGANDPRSTNQTLGEGWTRKGIALDLAYVDWKPVDGLTMSLGKMPQPWYKPTGYFFDADLNPEGIAVRYAGGPFFANAFGMWLSERSTASDATLLGGQVGIASQLGGVKLTGALGYFDVGSVQGEVTTTSSLPCTANPAFFGGPQGNTTVLDGAGCPTLLYDFNMLEALAQAEFSVGSQPVQLFAQYIQNQEADDLDTGWLAGFTFGQAGNPQTWEFGYLYGVMEKDAQFGQLVDSDFGGGVTDVDGSVFKLGYAPAKNWILNGTWFLNERFIDAPGATGRSYDRYQVDLNYRF